MSQPSQQTIDAIRLACDCILTAAESEPTGAPEGPIYAALSSHGMSLSAFQSIVSALVRAGKIRKEGNLLFAA